MIKFVIFSISFLFLLSCGSLFDGTIGIYAPPLQVPVSKPPSRVPDKPADSKPAIESKWGVVKCNHPSQQSEFSANVRFFLSATANMQGREFLCTADNASKKNSGVFIKGNLEFDGFKKFSLDSPNNSYRIHPDKNKSFIDLYFVDHNGLSPISGNGILRVHFDRGTINRGQVNLIFKDSKGEIYLDGHIVDRSFNYGIRKIITGKMRYKNLQSVDTKNSSLHLVNQTGEMGTFVILACNLFDCK